MDWVLVGISAGLVLLVGSLLAGGAAALYRLGQFSRQEEAQEAAYRKRHCGGGNAD